MSKMWLASEKSRCLKSVRAECATMKLHFTLLVLSSITGVRESALAQSGWRSPSPAGSNTLWSSAVLDANTVVAVGDAGTIVRTTDGGQSWTLQSSGTTRDLRGVSFVDADTGTAVGFSGTILRTTDGGQTWTLQA